MRSSLLTACSVAMPLQMFTALLIVLALPGEHDVDMRAIAAAPVQSGVTNGCHPQVVCAWWRLTNWKQLCSDGKSFCRLWREDWKDIGGALRCDASHCTEQHSSSAQIRADVRTLFAEVGIRHITAWL